MSLTKYPAFINDNDYMKLDDSVSEIEQLKRMVANLTRLHLLSANKFESFDELIREYLNSGIEIFGLETGIVSQVNAKKGTYSIKDVISPLDVLEQGQEFALKETYCREVVQSESVLGFPRVGSLDFMKSHPVYQNLKLEAYLSAPIFAGKELYGTLNFTSIHARENGFSAHEHNLILLMANSIGAFVFLRRKERRLKQLNEKMKQFVGFVSHDLRNPLGVILGFAQLGMKPSVPDSRLRSLLERIIPPAERAVELVNTILDNAALSLGKITLHRTEEPLRSVLTECINSVEPFALEQSIDIQLELADELGEHTIWVDRARFVQSLVNLLINAIKYSEPGKLVTLSIEPQTNDAEDNALSLAIENPLESHSESFKVNDKFYGSVGFGMDIAENILQAHSTQLHVRKSDERYRVYFALPQKQAHR